MYNLVNKIVEENTKQVIEWRRHFHQHPELSFEEFETSEYIIDELKKMGYDVRTHIGGTGVVATFDTGKKGPVIAFRADIDALPILEESGLEFESQKAGVMHACGHDCHAAILLGTAKVISQMENKFCGIIKFIFQPGEEANGGAKCVINDGALKNPDVESIFALHMMPDLPTGTIAIKPGYLSATDDEFIIKVHGKGAHSSEPQLGINAIILAAHIITSLESILNNNISPFDAATFSICQITGGDAVNVIPDYLEMKGMIRCIEKHNKEIIRSKMKKIVESTASSMDGKGEITFIPGFPSVNNDSYLTKVVVNSAEEVLKNKDDVIMINRPHMGSEDFAYFQEEIPGAMFMLGCAQEDCLTGALHSSELNINENALPNGVKIFVNIALSLCGIK